MPTGRETIINRRLSGAEARALIAADFETLLANEGLLSHYVAYGRIGWDIELRLHVENALAPESRSSTASRPDVAAGVGSAPLDDPAPGAVIAASTISRAVESPNAERLRTGLPVTLDVKQQDGTVSQRAVEYPVDASVGSVASISDSGYRARADWEARLAKAKERKAAGAQAAGAVDSPAGAATGAAE